MISKEKIYVIILNYNNYYDTFNCIDSLLKNSNEICIVIVDNHSANSSFEEITRNYPNITCLKTDYNGGYAFGMNYGAKYALLNGAEYVLLLNNDTTVEKDAIKLLVQSAQKDDNIGIVSPKVLYMHDKNLIYSAGGEFKKWLCVGKGRFQRKETNLFGNEDREIDFAEGSCLLVKRKVFEEIGFIPEKYFMYFEDLDFSLKVNKKFNIYYCSKAVIYHKAGGGTSWLNASPLYNFYFTRNRILFYKELNAFWQYYSILFSLIIVLLKTFLIILKGKKKNDLIKSLWKGLGRGLAKR